MSVPATPLAREGFGVALAKAGKKSGIISDPAASYRKNGIIISAFELDPYISRAGAGSSGNAT
jgi:hypothetical protein